MSQTIDQLLVLRVVDVMAKTVVSVSENQTMSEVAETFREHQVSSAPVLNDQGRCVGILSAADFVRREYDTSHRDHPIPGGNEPQMLPAVGNRPLSSVPLHEDFAGYHMSPAVQSIDSGASLINAARVMCAEHIHRLLVLDENERPAGVVSTMDIVAAMVNVVDAMGDETARRQWRQQQEQS